MRRALSWTLIPAVAVALLLAGTAGAAKPGPAVLYTISFSDPASSQWVQSNCVSEGGSVLARKETTGPRAGMLWADGTDLNLNLHTDVQWTRKYPAPTSGVFDDCFGVTPSLNGNLFIDFERDSQGSVIHLIWHFDYYIASGVREHFTLQSEHIPFPEWTGANISSRVTGKFDLQYSLREGNKTIASYASLTGGLGRQFDFLLTITRVSQ